MRSADHEVPPDQLTPGYLASFEPSMRQALELARSGSAEDVPVGAVVLAADRSVLGRGSNQCVAAADPTAHAEVVALRQAARAAGSWRLDGCTLVVTLEPCTMCAGALVAARIASLVYGATDPRAGAAGSIWDVVRDRRLGPPVEVIGGVLAPECAELVSDFFARLRREQSHHRGRGSGAAAGDSLG
jgi:tRNA(adenine34) deaminase